MMPASNGDSAARSKRKGIRGKQGNASTLTALEGAWTREDTCTDAERSRFLWLLPAEQAEQEKVVKPIGRLVPVRYTPYGVSTSGLLPRGLRGA